MAKKTYSFVTFCPDDEIYTEMCVNVVRKICVRGHTVRLGCHVMLANRPYYRENYFQLLDLPFAVRSFEWKREKKIMTSIVAVPFVHS